MPNFKVGVTRVDYTPGIRCFPIKKAFNQGGHGTTIGTTLYQPGTGDQMVEAAISQLNKLFG